ncbi:MAG: hypothetical protein KGJ78_05040 [Alphaproteobacteria bacterium]|nr:hypothetical protein [Alphaproteobacteria bacterium]
MTLWPFGSTSFLDPDDEAWQLALWCWFLGQFGGIEDVRRSPLVLPTRTFFPPTDKTGHARAEHIFACVKKLARMPDWPCRLLAQPRRAELLVNESTVLKPITHAPAGTFAFDGDDVVITYEESAINDPGQLIATLAHELAHYLLHNWRAQAPGGEELHEPATDVMTVYMGFGLFGAAACFDFHSDDTGWRWQRHGYLSQRAWLFALAIFLELRNEEASMLKPFLKSHLLSDLNEAVRYARKKELIAQMMRTLRNSAGARAPG